MKTLNFFQKNATRRALMLMLVVAMVLGFNSAKAQTVIPQNGLVAFYPFDDNADDESGFGHNGIVYGAIPVADRHGNPNSAYSFDGVDDYIEMLTNNLNFPLGTSFSISLWVKAQPQATTEVTDCYSTETINYGQVFNKYGCPYGLSGDLICLFQQNGQLIYELRGRGVNGNTYPNGGHNGFTLTNTINYNEFVFVTMIKNAGANSISLYINGNHVSTTNFLDDSNDGQIPLLFGKQLICNGCPEAASGAFFNGVIDQFRAYNRVLTEAEIQALYHEDDPFTEITTDIENVYGGATAWGDFDNDGFKDVIVTGSRVVHNQVPELHYISKLYKNMGNGNFTEQTQIDMPGVICSAVAWSDINNDGWLDLILTGADTQNTNVLKLYINNRNGTFADQTNDLPAVRYPSLALGDYDNDGDEDLLLAGSYITKIYQNDNGTFTLTPIILQGVNDASASWGDYDADGDLDILVSGAINNTQTISIVYRNIGNGIFDDINASLSGASKHGASWGDYDNDGDLDILFTGATGEYPNYNPISKVYEYENGIFNETQIVLAPVFGNASDWADFNNNGNMDILITGYSANGYTKLYKNDGNDNFTEITFSGLENVAMGYVNWVDYNNDGYLDVFLIGHDVNEITSTGLYRNNGGTVANTQALAPTNLQTNVTCEGVTFSWNKTTDNETPQDGLSYNIYIRSELGEVDIKSPMSDLTNGYRRVVQMGNLMGNVNSWTINDLPSGTYYWSVQAVDNGLMGGNWATEKQFTVVDVQISTIDQTVTSNNTFTIDVNTTELLESDDISAFQFTYTYDANLLQYEGTTNGTLASGVMVNASNSGVIYVSYASADALVGAGSLIRFTFTALDCGTTTPVISDFYYNETLIGCITNGTITSNSSLICGDLTGNGIVQAYDASKVVKFVVDPLTFPLTNCQLEAADVAETYGEVDEVDASTILQFVNHVIDELECGGSNSGKSFPIVDVDVKVVNNQLVFTSKGDLFAFKLVANENSEFLNEPIIKNFAANAKNITASEYKVAMASAFAINAGDDFMTIPLKEGLVEITLELRINGVTKIKIIPIPDPITIYPNPVRNLLTISGIEEPTVATVCSVSGSIMQITELNSGSTEINVNNLAKGVYILKLQTATNVVVKRFIKQ